MDFHQIWYGRYAIGAWSLTVLFNFLQSPMTTRRFDKFVRLEDDDSIIHDPLRMRDVIVLDDMGA
jgi:hypothetical protein